MRGAARKHQVAVSDLPKIAKKFADDLAALDAAEARLVALGKELDAAKAAYDAAARALSDARKAAAGNYHSVARDRTVAEHQLARQQKVVGVGQGLG